ncbi:hypothetical protein QJS04_geneDACA002710 [Acorus gramineus]|uniref:Endonuclease/exonuclease/phosphatase domain-containing protein n=1 Tax=Acorus gramineus TaxID=55184 RepID=A0AAV9AQ66_ACOGR|nr:hypothetical protein QJS04_geneDACA002710 [Acorus gramineus]
MANSKYMSGKLLPHYQLLNPSLNGRIWLLWQPSLLSIDLLSFSDQFMHCKVSPASGQPSFFLTAIYASNITAKRFHLWDELRQLSSSVGSGQWILGGDFNEVRFSHEKVGGRGIYSRRMNRFNDCIFYCNLLDLKSMGSQFSWNNHQTNRIACKLDHVLVNTSWLHCNVNGFVQVLPEGLSDHSPLQVTVQPSFPTGPRPFKYIQAWEQHPEFSTVVSRAWRQNFEGSSMF